MVLPEAGSVLVLTACSVRLVFVSCGVSLGTGAVDHHRLLSPSGKPRYSRHGRGHHQEVNHDARVAHERSKTARFVAPFFFACGVSLPGSIFSIYTKYYFLPLRYGAVFALHPCLAGSLLIKRPG